MRHHAAARLHLDGIIANGNGNVSVVGNVTSDHTGILVTGTGNVNVQGKEGEDVGIFTKTRGSEALAGVVITVIDSEHVVLVNVVGDIKPDQVAALGESLKIRQLKEAGEAAKK